MHNLPIIFVGGLNTVIPTKYCVNKLVIVSIIFQFYEILDSQSYGQENKEQFLKEKETPQQREPPHLTLPTNQHSSSAHTNL